MKRMLLVVVAAMMVSSIAMADAIGVFTDETAASCNLASGFSQSATVVYFGWTVGGSTGARFKVSSPAGSTLFGFTTPYVTIGDIANDLSIAFGGCVEGTFPLGTIVAVWAPGNGTVAPADGFAAALMTDCSFGEYPIFRLAFCVDAPAGCSACYPGLTRQSTWGQVKALYR